MQNIWMHVSARGSAHLAHQLMSYHHYHLQVFAFAVLSFVFAMLSSEFAFADPLICLIWSNSLCVQRATLVCACYSLLVGCNCCHQPAFLWILTASCIT
jgi:hypothetical protein